MNGSEIMARVSVVKCETYDMDKVQKAVDETLNNLGGLERFVKRNDRVFLKLNLIIKKSPEDAGRKGNNRRQPWRTLQ